MSRKIAIAELARLKVIETEGDGVERARQRVELAESELAAFLSAVSAADVGADAFAGPPRARAPRGDRHSASQHARRDRATARAVTDGERRGRRGTTSTATGATSSCEP